MRMQPDSRYTKAGEVKRGRALKGVPGEWRLYEV
jgi:hypothetical protein